MAILLSQDYKEPGDNRGSRKKPQTKDLRSGGLYGQYHLRGSILTIQDTRDAISGFIAFGNNIATIPTSNTPTPVNASGLLLDYTGLSIWRNGVLQAAVRGTDGITGGGGVVLLDANGLTLTDMDDAKARIKWNDGTDTTATIGVFSDAGVSKMTLQINEDQTFDDGRFHLNVFDTSGGDTLFRLIAIDGGTHHAELGGTTFNGLTIGSTANPEAMLDVRGGMCLNDGISAPTAVANRAFIYVDTADGDLKVRFGDGVTKTLATDT